MPDELRNPLPNPEDPVDETVAPVMAPAPPEPAAGKTDGLSQRQKAWLGMGAVLVALALLTLMPDGSIDPDAPPPAANPAAAPLSGVDSGLPPSAWTRRCISRSRTSTAWK